VSQYTAAKTSLNGIWWVLVDELPRFPFHTRKEARDFCNLRGVGQTPPRPCSDICDVVKELGLGVVLEHVPTLHPYERQALNLTLTGHSQSGIARVLGVSQPSVHYTLSRVSQRISYLATRPKFDLGLMQRDLRDIPKLLESDPEILVDFWVCGNQSNVARKYGRTQGWVRHRILRATQCILKHAKWRAESGVEWAIRCMAYRDAVLALVSKGSIMTLATKAR
jgi:hypothetical protein